MLDKNFRQWMGQCHRDLDKTCMYQELMPAEDMRQLRNVFGHSTTFFKHVTDGSRTIEVCCQGKTPTHCSLTHGSFMCHKALHSARSACVSDKCTTESDSLHIVCSKDL